jgi:hypothetical protein
MTTTTITTIADLDELKEKCNQIAKRILKEHISDQMILLESSLSLKTDYVDMYFIQTKKRKVIVAYVRIDLFNLEKEPFATFGYFPFWIFDQTKRKREGHQGNYSLFFLQGYGTLCDVWPFIGNKKLFRDRTKHASYCNEVFQQKWRIPKCFPDSSNDIVCMFCRAPIDIEWIPCLNSRVLLPLE